MQKNQCKTHLNVALKMGLVWVFNVEIIRLKRTLRPLGHIALIVTMKRFELSPSKLKIVC